MRTFYILSGNILPFLREPTLISFPSTNKYQLPQINHPTPTNASLFPLKLTRHPIKNPRTEHDAVNSINAIFPCTESSKTRPKTKCHKPKPRTHYKQKSSSQTSFKLPMIPNSATIAAAAVTMYKAKVQAVITSPSVSIYQTPTIKLRSNGVITTALSRYGHLFSINHAC